MLEDLAQDARLALRSLTRSGGFTAVVVLTLALGIGATTAIFSVVDGVLLAPLPFKAPEEIVMVWENDRLTGTLREAASVPDFYDFKERNRSFRDLAAYLTRPVSHTVEGGEPQRLASAAVTANLASLLGVEPRLGRTIAADEDRPGAAPVALLTDAFWSRGFGRDPGVVGRTLELDDEVHTVIGVLPPGLAFPDRDTDVWVALRQGPDSAPRARHFISVIARLLPGTAVSAAQDDMSAVASQLEAEHSENRARGVFVEPLDEVLRGEVRPALLLLFGAVFAVLAIACANVANLLLVRGTSRARELAVCVALGAGSRQLARRFLVESLLVTAAAAALGVVLAFQGLRALLALAPAQIEALGDVGVDAGVLVFTVAISAAVGVGFALVPTFQARRLDVQSSLKEGRGETGGRERMALRRLLVVSQVALALVLLVAAGLLMGSLWRLERVDPGFRAAGVLRVDFQLPATRYPRDFSVWPRWSEVHNFHRELLDRAKALPGVRSAALTTNHPLDPGFTNSFVIVGGEAEYADQGELKNRLVSGDYFRTAGVDLLEGRLLTDRDTVDAPPVMLLNRAAVERYFPEGTAIGRQVSFWGVTREIVGVVADERMEGLRAAAPPAMYVSILQAPPVSGVTLMLRTGAEPRRLVGAVREAIWSLDRELAVYNVATMEETLESAVARERFTSVLLGLFAAVAVLLAALGVHGVLSYLVARRHREVGLRMALGATRRQVLGMVVSQGMSLVAAGALLGLAGALAASRLLAGLLYGVSATDPLTFAAVAALLLAAALAACLVPAGRAVRVDPASALRSE